MWNGRPSNGLQVFATAIGRNGGQILMMYWAPDGDWAGWRGEVWGTGNLAGSGMASCGPLGRGGARGGVLPSLCPHDELCAGRMGSVWFVFDFDDFNLAGRPPHPQKILVGGQSATLFIVHEVCRFAEYLHPEFKSVMSTKWPCPAGLMRLSSRTKN